MLGSCGKKRKLGREVGASQGGPPANSEDRSKFAISEDHHVNHMEDGQARAA